jgi:hypothetical protein
MSRCLRFVSCALLFVAGLSSSGGCAKQAQPLDFGSPDGHEVAKLITEDLQENIERRNVLVERVFVKGATPAGKDYERFSKCEFDIVGKPAVSGTEATAKIVVRNASDNQKLGECEWTFTQVTAGGKSVWKIKSAPLP